MPWSARQQAALAVTPKISSLFSLAGSIWIIVEVYTAKTKLSHSYHRLMLAMGLYDVAESIWNFMSTWPIPVSDSGERSEMWAVGNTQTCSAQGFFLTISVAVPIYNAFLALYYMLVVNHNFSDQVLRKRVEPAMHAIAFVWAFGTAFYSAVTDLLNDANLWCWIASFPAGCLDSLRYGDEGNCSRGDNAWLYRWVFYFAPLWFCILFATISTLLVYWRVRSLDKRTLRYRMPESTRDMKRATVRVRAFSHQSASGSHSFRSNASVGASSVESAAAAVREFDLALEEQMDDEFLSGLANETSSSTQSFVQRWRSHRKIYREEYTRSVEVAHQAVWYLVAFYITHVWSTSNRIVQQLNNGKTRFGLIFVHSWFDPFQGFLNFVIYQRPRYLKIRKGNPGLPWYLAVSRSLRFSYSPSAKQPRRSTSSETRDPDNTGTMSTSSVREGFKLITDKKLSRIESADDVEGEQSERLVGAHVAKMERRRVSFKQNAVNDSLNKTVADQSDCSQIEQHKDDVEDSRAYAEVVGASHDNSLVTKNDDANSDAVEDNVQGGRSASTEKAAPAPLYQNIDLEVDALSSEEFA